MSNQSKTDKMQARYQKALMTSLLSLSEKELAIYQDLPQHEEPTNSGQPSKSKTNPSTPTRPQDSI